MGGTGGGGGSGAVKYPTHVTEVHQKFLEDDPSSWPAGYDAVAPDPDTDMLTPMTYWMERLFNTRPSPYTSAYSYDPEGDLDVLVERWEKGEAFVELLDPVQDWLTYVENAVSQADDEVLSDSQIEDAVDAFEDRQQPKYANMVSRFEAGMADIGAVMNSSFVVGKALILNQYENDVAEFNAQLSLQDQKDRMQFILEAVRQQGQLTMQRIQAQQAQVGSLAEVYRLRFVSLREFLDKDLELDVRDATWQLSLYQYAANMLAAPGGGTHVPGASTHTGASAGSVLGGAFSGAAAGAMLSSNMAASASAKAGTLVNPVMWPIALGALAGGLMGAF